MYGEVGRSCLTSLPKRVVSCNFYRLSQIFLSSLHSQNLIYSWILWQIIQLFADVVDGNWVILCSQSLCPLIQLWNQELPNYPSALTVWLLSSVFVGQGIFGGSQRSGCSRCALPCGKQEAHAVPFVISRMTPGVRTHRKRGRAGLSNWAPVAPHSSSSRVASGFYAKHLHLVLVCFGRKTDIFAWLQKQQPVVLLF